MHKTISTTLKLSFLAAALGTPLVCQPHPGIHQIQSEYYRTHYQEPTRQPADEPIIPKQPRSTLTPTHTIFGYHPYWRGTAWQNYNYNLLTTIAYFSAEANWFGGFSSLHGWPVTDLINEAHSHGVDVVLTVTMFDSDNLITLLSSASYRQNLIDNLVAQVQAGNADGVNVDFEGLPSSQRWNMVTFIEDLAEIFHTEIPGSQVTLAMPAVDWSGAWDYDAIAEAADGLFIMGYDYHWSGSSTTGPVAPLTGGTYNVTWTVQDYLTETGGDADKLILGVPYYGFEWPASSSSAGANTLGSGIAKLFDEMEALALTYGKNWHSSSQTPWYVYQNTQWKQGWYDDSLSLSLKYEFARNQDLQGVGIWALSYDGSNNDLWEALAAQFGASTAPTTPDALSIRNVGDGSILIDFDGAQTASEFVVLRRYLGSNTTDTLGVYNQRPVVISGLNTGESYYLQIAARNEFGSSPETELLGVTPTTDIPKVLIVNGFDRLGGTTNTRDFVRQHGEALIAQGATFDAAGNEAILNETVALLDYEIIDWILGEEGTSTSTFTLDEQNLVKQYLQNGGRLLVSGSEIGYDLVAQGSSNDQQFYQNYLKAQYFSDAAGGQQGTYSAFGVDGTLLESITNVTFDNGFHGTYDVDWPDGIKPAGGASIIMKYDDVDYNANGGAGISYNGPFGGSTHYGAIIYLSVGFEAIYPETKRDELMDHFITYFDDASVATGDEHPRSLPTTPGISSIYPNPSNSAVTISYSLPPSLTDPVRLTIFDINGRQVWQSALNPGPNSSGEIHWEGRLSDGKEAPSGVYLVTLDQPGNLTKKKFTLLK